MSTRVATVDWHGSLVEGSGVIDLTSSGQANFDYSLSTRAADQASTTSPEDYSPPRMPLVTQCNWRR